MSLSNILCDLQHFVLTEHSDAELLAIQQSLHHLSDEGILLETLQVLPSKEEIQQVHINEQGEKMCQVKPSSCMRIEPSRLSSLSSGESIYLRSSLCKRLNNIAKKLKKEHDLGLVIKCGYRNPNVQAEAFENALLLARKKFQHL